MSELRSNLIRLANSNPELRVHLLPLLKESTVGKTGSSVTYAWAVKDASVELIGASRGDLADEGRAFLSLLSACSTFVKKGRLGSNQTALLIKRATDQLNEELSKETPSKILGPGGATGYSLEIIRGMQIIDPNIQTRGQVALGDEVQFRYVQGDIPGTVRSILEDGRVIVEVYTYGRREAFVTFPSTFDVMSVAKSKLPRMIMDKLSVLNAWAE